MFYKIVYNVYMNGKQETNKKDREMKKVTSHYTAYQLINYISEHPEITMIQGWPVNRTKDGRFYSFGNWQVVEHQADVETVYEMRKDINDWVERNS